MGLLFPTKITPSQLQEMLDQILPWILDFSTPEAVVLFGSAARGEMTVGSDLDLALIYRDHEACEKARLNLRKRPAAIDWAIDYLFYTRDEFEKRKKRGGVCELIAEEGRLLYGGPL